MNHTWHDYQNFLNHHFPNLTLDADLFHSWPIGLRFELGGDLKVEDGRLQQAAARASEIFEAAFADEPNVLLLARRYDPDDFFWSLVQTSGRLEDDLQIRRNPSLDATSNDNAVYFALRIPRDRLDHRTLFTAIANTDHVREPHLAGRVFLINTATPLIFHMYDDRGCDLIAAQRESLVLLYRRFNAWLLDYDRPQMDASFSNP